MPPEHGPRPVVAEPGDLAVALEARVGAPLLDSGAQQGGGEVERRADHLLAAEGVAQDHLRGAAAHRRGQVAQLERAGGQDLPVEQLAVDVDLGGGAREHRAGQAHGREAHEVGIERELARHAQAAEECAAAEGAGGVEAIADEVAGEPGAVVHREARQAAREHALLVAEGGAVEQGVADAEPALAGPGEALEVDRAHRRVEERGGVRGVDQAGRPALQEVLHRRGQQRRRRGQARGQGPLVHLVGDHRRERGERDVDDPSDRLAAAREAAHAGLLEVRDPHEDVRAPQPRDHLAALHPVDVPLQDGLLRLDRLGARGPAQQGDDAG